MLLQFNRHNFPNFNKQNYPLPRLFVLIFWCAPQIPRAHNKFRSRVRSHLRAHETNKVINNSRPEPISELRTKSPNRTRLSAPRFMIYFASMFCILLGKIISKGKVFSRQKTHLQRRNTQFTYIMRVINVSVSPLNLRLFRGGGGN